MPLQPSTRLRPKDFGLDNHDEFRPGQLETIQFILEDSPVNTTIVEAMTGSGKSAIGVALGQNEYQTVSVLTKTKSLQQQYEEYQDVQVLFGISNYECAELPPFDGSYCSHTEAMLQCPSAAHCQYLIRRKLAKEGYRRALSYPYHLQASWTRNNLPDYLYCDEAHELPNVVMDHMTLTLTPEDARELEVSTRWPTKFKFGSESVRKKMVSNWLSASVTEIEATIDKWEEKRNFNPRISRKITLLTRKMNQIHYTNQMLMSSPGSFHLTVEDDKLEIAPLTAKYAFQHLFPASDEHKLVLTSATIGNPAEFAATLGIDDYRFLAVPSNFSPEEMPIMVPKGAPKMNYRSGEVAKHKHATLIAGLINTCDPSWNGLIHTTSKVQTRDLAQRLGRLGLQDRLWIPPENVGTEKRVVAWAERLARVPNTICISWAFHEGVDAHFAQINIIAKIPYGGLDGLGKARMEYDKTSYSWRTAILTMQASGRIRRGEPDHYEYPGEPMHKLVAIVDANVWGLRKYYSDHFNECLTKI